MKICWKITHPQAIQVEFVSSSEQIWRNVALHHLLTPMDPLQWMGAVRKRVQTADKNITSNLHHSSPSVNIFRSEKVFCHDNSRRDCHGNVHDNVNVFGLGRIDLLHCCCGRASTETCNANTSTTCCCDCEHVRNIAAANITYMKQPPNSIHKSLHFPK